MIYQTLAHFYDALVEDEEATKNWVTFIERVLPKGNIMELACGSGEITLALAQDGYQMYASDLSQDMIHEAMKKAGSDCVEWKQMDMCNFTENRTFNGILCLCDSFNYLLEDEQVKQLFQDIYDHLKSNGIFIMDMHAKDRLVEFEEEYNEAGSVDGQQYQWTIFTNDDCVCQNFAFYDHDGNVTLEQHIQRVYDPMIVDEWLHEIGFKTEIWTDFTHSGVCEGEKQFYICRKETL